MFKKSIITSAVLAIAGSQQHSQAATVTTDALAIEVTGRDFDVLFDPIDDVSELVMISAGSVVIDEGGSLTISAILIDNSIVQLFNEPNITNFGFFSTETLSSVTSGNNFTPLPFSSTVKGLRFDLEGIWNPMVTLPVGTTFSFTVPEASSAMLSMFGIFLLATRRSRSQA